MSEFFDYDPHSGVSKYFDYDEMTGKATITSKMDAGPILQRAHELRQSDTWQKGVKENWAPYAFITPIMEIEMRHRGIKLSDPGATKAILKYINEECPHMRMTNAWEGRKHRGA